MDEFKTMLGYNAALRAPRAPVDASTWEYADVTPPEEIDWVASGAVTPVKNQKQCGSCWAFSTTGAVEGINAIKTGKLISLSEEELISCSTNGNMGCNGGLMDNGFEWIVNNRGINTEDAGSTSPRRSAGSSAATTAPSPSTASRTCPPTTRTRS